jgi:HlyD family secretion protein
MPKGEVAEPFGNLRKADFSHVLAAAQVRLRTARNDKNRECNIGVKPVPGRIGSRPFKHHRTECFAIAGLCFVLLFAAGCSEEPAEKEAIVRVRVAEAQSKTIEQRVNAEAVLFPLAQSAIVPKISAPVKTFYVNRGSIVRAGQLLAVLENKDLAAATVDTKGSYDQAQATYEISTASDLPQEIQKSELDVEAARKLLDAQQKVYDSRQELFQQGALPRKELDQSGVDLTQARNQYEMAQKHLEALTTIGRQNSIKSAAGQLESAKGKYLGAEAQLSYSEIRSPINGVIADRPLYPGEMATSGVPLLTVMNIAQVIARSHIPQPEAALLKIGDEASIMAPGGEQGVEGKVTVISPALDSNSTTVEVWVEAKNPRQDLKPGTSLRLSMLAGTVPDAVVIPAESLLTAEDGKTSVMLAGSDGRAHQKEVNVGIRQGDEVQIAEGLKAGDHVITSGAYGLPDNTKITIEQPSAQAEKPSAEKTESGARD